MTHDELTTFWKIAESNYISIKILEILNDSYGIQIKIDYTLILRQERLKSLTINRGINIGIQVRICLLLKLIRRIFFFKRQYLMKDHHREYVNQIILK